jgi:serine/threonine-protein kinase
MAQALRRWLAAQTGMPGAAEPSVPTDYGTLAAAAVPADAPRHGRTRSIAVNVAAAAVLSLAVIGGALAWWTTPPDAAVALPFAAPPVAVPATGVAAPSKTQAVVPAPADTQVTAATTGAAPSPAPSPGPSPAPTAATARVEPAADAAKAAPVLAAPKPRKAPKAVAAAPVATEAAAPPVGTVHIAISPWGHVEVDGKPAGTTPPLTRLELAQGAHTITVRNEDFPVHTLRVVVDPERPVTVKHRFGS